MQDAVIAADLGPNPAPVCELVWALHRQRDLRVREAHLLTNAHGWRHLDELRHGLDLLREPLGPGALSWGSVRVTRARDAEGAFIEDELSPADADAWTHSMWENFRRAIRSAGERPVVFALVGGRRRTMGALTAAMYQLLARPQDLCVDVRVDEPRVEGARAGFFFPEQRAACADEQGPIDPASVEVMLVDLRLPRLRRLVREHDLLTYDQALIATGAALDAAAIPSLHIDVPARRVEIDGRPVALSEAGLIWYTTLALARLETPEGWVASADHDAPLERVMDAFAAGTSAWTPRSTRLAALRGGAVVQQIDLSPIKSKMIRALRGHCRERGIVWQDLVVPTRERYDGNAWRQRIALAPERITVRLTA